MCTSTVLPLLLTFMFTLGSALHSFCGSSSRKLESSREARTSANPADEERRLDFESWQTPLHLIASSRGSMKSHRSYSFHLYCCFQSLHLFRGVTSDFSIEALATFLTLLARTSQSPPQTRSASMPTFTTQSLRFWW